MLPAGDYRLTVARLTAGAEDYEFALHELSGAVQTLSAASHAGSLSSDAASALFRFDGQAGDRLYFDVQRWTGSEMAQWGLVSPAGKVVKTGPMGEYSSLPEENAGDECVLLLPSSGTWFLVVERDGTYGGGASYELALSPIVDGSESRYFGEEIDASITSPTEVDTYTFSVTTPTLVHFDSRTDSADLVWSLVDGAGPLVSDRAFANRTPAACQAMDRRYSHCRWERTKC